QYVHASRDGGDHWQTVFTQSGFLAADPSDANVLYLAAQQAPPPFTRTPLKSTDRGLHWTPIVSGLPSDDRSTSVWIAPSAPSVLFVAAGFGAGLFTSRDAGASWSPSMDGLVNTSVGAFAVGSDGALYAAQGFSGLGPLAVSRDGGATWRPHLGA